MPVDPVRVQAVFLAAIEQENPADRAAVVDRQCCADAELRQRVEALLKAHEAPGPFLDAGALVWIVTVTDRSGRQRPSVVIGPH